jgi:hypothetical protein
MSKLARALILGAMLAAMHLAGLTAVAQAQANDPDGMHAQQLATQGQVGESHRNGHGAPVAAAQSVQADAVERFRRGERASQEQSTTAEAVEEFRRGERASQQQPTDNPTQAPTPLRPAEPSGQPTWVLASLGGLAAGLALAGGLAVLAARRAGRRARVGHWA